MEGPAGCMEGVDAGTLWKWPWGGDDGGGGVLEGLVVVVDVVGLAFEGMHVEERSGGRYISRRHMVNSQEWYLHVSSQITPQTARICIHTRYRRPL